ncbi:penicillin-binding protein [Lottiidibacillus patelloidae]|uniref:Penicillin-binding protein n=1 Tax=Lottiidibacillus patelloidae TaxID=2670334 RepID=A0A263BWR7_9BACI|nr:PBP1A family penicillin-binding protein [Lottiidibacillus patelloidae]OZM58165.1 penicillin-binding protein [Lottiidibacillus patelloidae]
MFRKGLLLLTIILMSSIAGLLFYILIIFLGDYVIDEKKLVMNATTVLKDEDGNELASLFIENRELVSIKDIPEHVQEAFIAIEDARFYKHPGIDLKAIARAIYKDLISGSKVQGGSTITQQLAKNIFLSHEKTWLRKTKEVVIALNLERAYTKKKLLEFYLNNIYFGHGAYGIQAAAELYFNKDVSDLSVIEGALLAALPKAPSHYSPIKNYEDAFERRNLVLAKMEREDYLDPGEAVRLQGKTINLDIKKVRNDTAMQSYIDLVLNEAEDKYHLTNEEIARGGYTIVVPMKKELQEVSYDYFQESTHFPGVDEEVEGALVLLNRHTGGVLAVQGGRNYVPKGLNRVNVKRQPGSTFKPIVVYSPALEEFPFHPYSILVDRKLSYDGYRPKNYNDVYDIQITMYDALLKSGNASAVWLLNEMGIDKGKEYAEKFGIQLSREDSLALALGGISTGVTPLQMAKAYSAFANAGEMVSPYFITAIYDSEGKVLHKREVKKTKVVSKQTAWYMTKMLEGVIQSGTGRYGNYEGTLAGKTGSTQNPNKDYTTKDAWFVGYTPKIVGALWMGYDKTSSEQYLTGGGNFPTVLFKKIISDVQRDEEVNFIRPLGVKDLEPPVRLPKVDDLKANLSFSSFGFLSVNLTWTPSEDERVIYNIYEVKNQKQQLIGTVIGNGSFHVSDVPIFGSIKYYVIPKNPQTMLEGKTSNEAIISFFKD